MANFWEAAPLATQSDADAWWKSAPVISPAAQQQAPDQGGGWVDTARDYAGAAGAGLARGAAGLAGLPGTISNIGQQAMDNAVGWATGRQPMPRDNPLDSQSLIQGMGQATGGATDYRGQSTGAQFVGAGAEAVPGALIGPGNMAANAALYGMGGGMAGEGASRLAAGAGFGEGVQGAARMAGGVLAPMAATRAITPFRMAPEQQAVNQTLASEGVPQTAGQKVDSRFLRAAESQLGGSATQRLNDAQKEQFTRAALNRVGINAERATPEVLRDGLDDIGQRFNDLASRTSVPIDQKIQTDLLDALQNYKLTASRSNQAPIVEKNVKDILGAPNGVLSGPQYQNIRSNIGKVAKSADGTTGGALRDIQNALDDAVGRNMPPEVLPAWQQVRQEYRDFLTIEKAATRAGADSASGLISPGALRSAAKSTEGTRASAAGRGNFDDLSRAGVQGMQSFPDSGTASRSFFQNLGGGLSAMGGAGGYMMGDVAGAIPGAIAGAAAPRVVGAGLMSRPVQSYLGNQAVNPASFTDPQILSLINTLNSQRQR